MVYKIKAVMDGVEVLEEGTCSIKSCKAVNSACLGTMEIGAAASDSITLTIENPFKSTFDGDKVLLYVSPEDEDTTKGDIEEEVGTDETDELIDVDELDEGVDDDDEGEELTPAEEADLQTYSAEVVTLQTAIFEGEADTIVNEDTDEAEEPEWRLYGTFYVYNQTNSGDSVILTCYDTLSLLNGTFSAAGTPRTYSEYWSALATELLAIGISLDAYTFSRGSDTLTIKSGTSHRETLSLLCGYAGGYATTDADGSVGISFYTYADKVLIEDELISISDTSAGEILVDGISCEDDRGYTIASSGGGQSLSFSNYLVTETVLNEVVAPMYKGIRFEGATINASWDEELVAGELIRVMTREEYKNFLELKNSDEDTRASENSLGRVILISTQEITFGGNATTTIKSVCETESAKEKMVMSPTIKKILEAGKTATNYITEADDGALVISRDTDDYSVRIDADSLDIMNGDILVASFGYDSLDEGSSPTPYMSLIDITSQSEAHVEITPYAFYMYDEYGDIVGSITENGVKGEYLLGGRKVKTNAIEPYFEDEEIFVDGAVNFAQGVKDGLFYTSTHTISLGTVASGASKNGSLTITKSGYYPIAIAGFSSGSSYLAMQSAYLTDKASGRGKINYRVRNISTSSSSGMSAEVYVLWYKYAN